MAHGHTRVSVIVLCDIALSVHLRRVRFSDSLGATTGCWEGIRENVAFSLDHSLFPPCWWLFLLYFMVMGKLKLKLRVAGKCFWIWTLEDSLVA